MYHRLFFITTTGWDIFNKALELNAAYQQNREWSWSGLITECFELGGEITVASLHYTHTYFAQSPFNSVE